MKQDKLRCKWGDGAGSASEVKPTAGAIAPAVVASAAAAVRKPSPLGAASTTAPAVTSTPAAPAPAHKLQSVMSPAPTSSLPRVAPKESNEGGPIKNIMTRRREEKKVATQQPAAKATAALPAVDQGKQQQASMLILFAVFFLGYLFGKFVA